MLKIKNLTVKNFMSVGNATQAIDFNRRDLTLVLGENLDLGGDDHGARNGTGKTTIINALSYAWYGQALTNIKRDNLINKTNGKNMLVTIEFEVGGKNYKIERGRRHNILKFYVEDVEQEVKDDSQGDSRETQAEIEKLLGMSHEMFKHIVALNTYTEPFLALRANEQRSIIEQLLGITLLSEKAESLKEICRQTKDEISKEEYRINAVKDANKRIEEQIESLKRRQALWLSKHTDDVGRLQSKIEELSHVDIEAEIALHEELRVWNETSKKLVELNNLLQRTSNDMARNQKTLEKVEAELVLLADHKCHSCGQALHDNTHEDLMRKKTELRDETEVSLQESLALYDKTNAEIESIGALPKKPKTFYATKDDAIKHKSTLENTQHLLETKLSESDPYGEQIHDMSSKALEVVTFDKLNELVLLKEHQEFLLKLLTNKDSFIRKRIIDQNLSYLNARLSQYLERLGLPHTVIFLNDLNVSITELGRDLDFDNLSRGERNRLILGLSWSFRDVWESLYQPINLLFIDELVDSGMDSSGVENALAILKKMSRESNKSIWLVSHKDELAGRVNNVLTVVKENGFTNYNTDVEVV